MTRLLLAASALTLYGCARCSNEPAVPFKLDPPPPAIPQVEAPAPDAGVGIVTTFATPADKPILEGEALPLTGVRALYEVDLDRDGDRDVLALTVDATQHALLQAMTRDGALSAPLPVAGFVAPEPGACTVADARFFSLSKEKAALRVELACTEQRVPSAAALWMLALEARPRIYERLDVLGFTPEGQPALTLVPRSMDRDGDHHDDISLRVSAYGALEADSLELSWLDRPSGLVRDTREPDTTLSAWAAAAQAQVNKQPDAAIARAELGLTLARAICRELGNAQLGSNGAAGISCGALGSLPALSTTLISAYAKRGDAARAFDQYRNLRGGARPSERQLELVQTALGKLPARSGVSLRHGPAVEPINQPRVHLPSARFLSDSSLYIHRLSPVLWDLDSGEETPAPRGDSLLRDPSGQLIASSIERTCEGLAVRIERAPPSGSDYTAAAQLSSALLAPLPSGPGCTRTNHRPDDGGFALLGWAPQGLVAVRGSEVRLVPLASNGHTNGDTRVLEPDAPRPAPLPAGLATRDGARYVEATPYGVLVYGPSSTQVELWRPEGYVQIAKSPLEAAISPSGARVAVVTGGSVYVLERVH